MVTKDPSVALVLASITSKTRVRLNVRGTEVESPADHAARLVRFMQHMAREPYLASPEHSERVIEDFNRMESELAGVTR